MFDGQLKRKRKNAINIVLPINVCLTKKYCYMFTKHFLGNNKTRSEKLHEQKNANKGKT